MDIGNLNNKYKILAKIHDGNNSNIYKAEDDENNIFAIKGIRNTSTIDKDFIVKFKKEINLLNNIDSENIVKVHDIISENDNYYIVMEYIDGISLKDLLKSKNALNLNEALNITKKIAYILNVVHKNNIIHRDLQPQNILISNDNEIKINNFGIVKSSISSSQNNIKDVISNINYISPEEILGGYIDKSVDFYSLGIILYEMVFGELPFIYCEDLRTLYENIINGIDYDKYHLNKSYKNVVHIIKKLCNKKPIERYKDISELLNDIHKIENNIDIYSAETKNKGLVSQNGSRVNRHKNKNNNKKNIKKYVVAGSVLLVLGIGTYTYVNSYDRSKEKQAFNESSESILAPDFKDLTKDEILEMAKSLGITVKIEEAYDENIEEGLVISQYPKAGSQVKKGDTINVIISKGAYADKNKVVVPDFNGKHLSEATAIANTLGIKLNVETSEDRTKPNGTVLSQSVSSGIEVDKESTITVVVNDIKRTETSNDGNDTNNNSNNTSKPSNNNNNSKPSKPNNNNEKPDNTNEKPDEKPDETNDDTQDGENGEQQGN